MNVNRGLGRPILNGQVNFPVCLAPMVGLSHVGLRLLVRDYLPKGAFTIWPTEMLNSRRLPHQIVGQTPETFKCETEVGLVPQILGNEAEPIRKSVLKLKEWGVSGIDINMGCPVNKALKHNYGVALMGDAGYAAEVVSMAVESSSLPVSVKMRAGLQSDETFLLKFVEGLESAGASWICLHPRLAEQKRRGSADWSQISLVRQKIKIPVIGNGDVQTSADVRAMLDQTGCDMVMIGRALAARPWLLWQVGEELGWPAPEGKFGSAPRSPEEEGAEMGRSLLRLIDFMEIYFALNLGLRKFQFYLRTTHSWLMFGHALHAKSMRAQSYDDLRGLTREFFSQPQSMTEKTDLRY